MEPYEREVESEPVPEMPHPSSHPVAQPRVFLTASGWRRWLTGHPWVFRDDLQVIEAEGGDCAIVLDPRGREVGRGLVSGRSKIALRVVTRQPGGWDDRLFLEDRLRRAAARRVHRAPDEAERVVCAEADDLPGLIIDRYADVFCVQHAVPYWERRKDLVIDVLRQHYRPRSIIARDEFSARGLEDLPRHAMVIDGEPVEFVTIREGNIQFTIDPLHGQKTGFFLDQRDNREKLARLARGRVLDVFSGDGSFAMHLAKGGAQSVVGVESSESAIGRARANAERNGVADRCDWVRAMAFDDLRERSRKLELFDIVILDPPAFAKNRQEVPSAYRGYAEINSRAMRLVAPGGLLATFSCSYHMTEELFHRMLYDAAVDCHRRVELVERLRQSMDHPILLTHPESLYLKGALLRIDS
jgi:23S rRNA (cytosine1962-C5)-methyltransferase